VNRRPNNPGFSSRAWAAAALLACLPGVGDAGAAEPAVASLDFAKDIRPILQKHCVGCHGPKKQKGDINFESFTDALSIQKDRKLWVAVVEQLRNGDMPPDDKPQPTKQQKQMLGDWVTHTLDHIDCEKIRHPGRETIHRLNRDEYRNTIRDLVGVDFDDVDSFPSDGDGGTGFDTNADSLFVPPILMEKYFQAADKILDEAIPSPPIELNIPAQKLNPTEGVVVEDGARVLDKDYQRRTAYAVAKLPRDGLYEFRIRAWGESEKAAPRFELKIDERTVRTQTVRVKKADGKPGDSAPPASTLLTGRLLKKLVIDKKPQRTSTRKRADPYEVAIKRRMREGVAKIELSYAQRQSSKAGKLLLDFIEIAGPSHASSGHSMENEKIFVAKPEGDMGREEAGRKIIAHFMRRAYRRPVTEEEMGRILGLFKRAEARGDAFAESVKLALKGVLISPRFLFRTERDQDKKGPYAITDHELASRLSYFIWSTMPDEELAAAADRGKLSDPAEIEKQVKRMLRDPKSRALAERFAGQWLGLLELGRTVRPDRRRFPEFSLSLRDAMVEEAVQFFDYIVRENRSLDELVDADYSFINEDLAKHYGMTGVSGSEHQKVRLRDKNRGGLLTMAGTLTVTPSAVATSALITPATSATPIAESRSRAPKLSPAKTRSHGGERSRGGQNLPAWIAWSVSAAVASAWSCSSSVHVAGSRPTPCGSRGSCTKPISHSRSTPRRGARWR